MRGARPTRIEPALRPRRGFTIVELAVAIVLISVGLLGSAALMATNLRHQRGAAAREEMVTLAESKLDEMTTIARTTKASGLRVRLARGGSLTTPVQNYADSMTTQSGKVYRRLWQVDSLAAFSRQVRVRIQPKYSDLHVPTELDFQTRVYIH
jgi:prepilin-type N-terminal cleavage/methylation domain-containing protein